jgi:hypothetical protein
MKFKYSILLFIIGWFLIILGVVFKFMHYSGSESLVTVGKIVQIIAIIIFVIKVIKHPKVKEFFSK